MFWLTHSLAFMMGLAVFYLVPKLRPFIRDMVIPGTKKLWKKIRRK